MAAIPLRLPRIIAASTLRCSCIRREPATASTSARAPHCPTSGRLWPKISPFTFRKEPAFYLKSYEQATDGRQLEDVQNARRYCPVFSEVQFPGCRRATL